MTRRSKLSLSPDHKVDKKQPAGFEAANASDPLKSTPDSTEPTTEHMETQDSTSGENKSASKTAVRPGGMNLIKVALVVVVAAFSLYLLKRRLM